MTSYAKQDSVGYSAPVPMNTNTEIKIFHSWF